jgi:hypothetical protein
VGLTPALRQLQALTDQHDLGENQCVEDREALRMKVQMLLRPQDRLMQRE